MRKRLSGIIWMFIQYASFLYISSTSLTTYIPKYEPSAVFFKFYSQINLNVKEVIDFNKLITNRCTLCTYSPSNYKPNSTPRDVIIADCRNTASGIIPFARSLRTVGSKASIVILTDDTAYKSISTLTTSFLEHCGVTIVNFGKELFPHDPLKKGIYWVYEFLKMNMHQIDRVVYCDLFDTFFQGDPFYEEFPEDELIVFDENKTVKDVNIVRKWFGETKLIKNSKELDNFKYKCAGNIAGSCEIVVKALGMLLALYQPGLPIRDQSILNILIFTGEYAANGIKATESDSKSFRLVAHMVFLPTGNHTIGSIKIHSNDNKALIIHQTHYHYELIDQIKQVCPMPTFENYIHVSKWVKKKPKKTR